MSANGTRTFSWVHGDDVFCLSRVGLILELEERCNSGLGAVFQRLGDGTWKFNDFRETIRLGLIGGGMEPAEASRVVKRHVDECDEGFGHCVLLAYEIVKSSILGNPKDDPVGKNQPEANLPGFSTTTGASDDQKSSPSAEPSA
jgi:hypothetical protein